MGSKVLWSEFKSHLYPLQVRWPWTNYLMSLCLSFLTEKILRIGSLLKEDNTSETLITALGKWNTCYTYKKKESDRMKYQGSCLIGFFKQVTMWLRTLFFCDPALTSCNLLFMLIELGILIKKKKGGVCWDGGSTLERDQNNLLVEEQTNYCTHLVEVRVLFLSAWLSLPQSSVT